MPNAVMLFVLLGPRVPSLPTILLLEVSLLQVLCFDLELELVPVVFRLPFLIQ
jgi:hypothetical protein